MRNSLSLIDAEIQAQLGAQPCPGKQIADFLRECLERHSRTGLVEEPKPDPWEGRLSFKGDQS